MFVERQLKIAQNKALYPKFNSFDTDQYRLMQFINLAVHTKAIRHMNTRTYTRTHAHMLLHKRNEGNTFWRINLFALLICSSLRCLLLCTSKRKWMSPLHKIKYHFSLRQFTSQFELVLVTRIWLNIDSCVCTRVWILFIHILWSFSTFQNK